MWGKLLKKYLLIFLLGFIVVEVAFAAATKFTDLQCRNLTVTGTQTNTGNITDAGNHTVTGTLTVTGAVSQSTTTFTGGLNLWARTSAQLNALTPSTTGQLVYCSDCTKNIVCVSSGAHPTTSVGAWVSVSTAAALASMPHCL